MKNDNISFILQKSLMFTESEFLSIAAEKRKGGKELKADANSYFIDILE